MIFPSNPQKPSGVQSLFYFFKMALLPRLLERREARAGVVFLEFSTKDTCCLFVQEGGGFILDLLYLMNNLNTA